MLKQRLEAKVSLWLLAIGALANQQVSGAAGAIGDIQTYNSMNKTVEINLLAQELMRQREDSLTLATSNSLNISDNQLTIAQDDLHFGAKIALSLLAATILLVAIATALDLQLSENKEQTRINNQMSGIYSQSSSPIEQVNQIQRSHSLSSSCSSNLFCSANSVVSASAPILGHANRKTNSQRPSRRADAAKTLKARRTSRWYRIAKRSANKHCNIQATPINDSQKRDHQDSCEDNTNITDRHNANIDQMPAIYQEDSFKRTRDSQESNTEHDEWTSRSQARVECHDEIAVEIVKETQKQTSHWLDKRVFLDLLLSFSARRSAAMIFQESSNQSETTKRSDREIMANFQTSPSLQRRANGTCNCRCSCSGHRSRVSSLSSINECTYNEDITSSSSSDLDEHSMVNSTDRCNTHDVPRSQSIDALHGLRFISMIWVIVIHSYNFALRWLFFTNSSSLESIYKTTASQLLANGSFACDSFFFASGFLLPCLTFVDNHKPPAQETGAQTQTSMSPNEMALSGVLQSRAQLAAVISAAAKTKSATGASNFNSKQQQQQQDSSQSSTNNAMMGEEQGKENRVSNFDLKKSSTNCWLGSNGFTDFASSQAMHVTSSASFQMCKSHNLSARFTIQSINNNINKNFEHHKQQQLHQQETHRQKSKANDTNNFNLSSILANVLHRYIRMMPLMMAIIGLSTTLLRYLGEGPAWQDSTMMYDKWCRQNWWINGLFIHNFLNRETMCLSHSWYSAVDIQLFLLGQLILYVLFRSPKLGLALSFVCLFGSSLITSILTLMYHLPAVPLISSVDEQTMNTYYGEIYIKPYCRASPYLIGMVQAYLMRTTSLGQIRFKKWQLFTGWTICLSTFVGILFAMMPAMNGNVPSEIESALYSSLSRPLWACATGWTIFTCITKQAGPIGYFLSAKCFAPFSRLTYPAFLIHPIVMAIFYGSRQSTFHFSHYLMLYLILGNIVITYASAFVLSSLFELPLLSVERVLRRSWQNGQASASNPKEQNSEKNSLG